MTRAEHHADSDASTVRNSRQIIQNLLEENCVGRDNAAPTRKFAEHTPLSKSTIRDVIAELRDDPAGPPIGSCADGYFIISSDAELSEYVASMNETIQTKRERLEANLEAYNRRRE